VVMRIILTLGLPAASPGQLRTAVGMTIALPGTLTGKRRRGAADRASSCACRSGTSARLASESGRKCRAGPGDRRTLSTVKATTDRCRALRRRNG
jgi:hypothetical protein